VKVTDNDRDNARKALFQHKHITSNCITTVAEAIAAARAEEREACIADLRASVKPCDERDQRCGCSNCEFAWEVQAIEDAIRARGED